ncbi:MAG: hypothetical protein KDE19_16475 [Caldilineaceae bacterium]|nr:hypothetical protein [Caldilineaceae bacterium]
MQYPLPEKIGPPDLLVGRVDEFARFHKWLKGIPRRISKSRVILARRKSGKTAFVQRLFNELWSENGEVVPFYFDIADKDVWLPHFAITYFQAFASQYISFLERDPSLVRLPLTLEKILDYGIAKENPGLIQDTEYLLQNQDVQHGDLLWQLASTAPHRYAAAYDQRFLVILDEFQNIASYIYPDPEFKTKPIASMPGSFHSLSESKYAPMLVTGSYIGILQRIMDEYLEAGRLSITRFAPYLTPEEGLEAVYKYAEIYQEPITNQSAQQINELCLADPFFISCVILSEFGGKDLTTTEGVIDTVNFEIADRESELSKTWAEYLRLTLRRVNGPNTKSLMLFLNKHDERFWTPRELKAELNLDLTEEEIYARLVLLAESDVILRGVADIDFRGLQDGTLNLILRHRYEKEIEGFRPNFKNEFETQLAALRQDRNRWRGRANHLAGMMAERMLAIELRTQKFVRLSTYFTLPAAGGVDDRELNLIDVRERVPYQRRDGTSEELDVVAKAEDGTVLIVEVRKRQEPTGIRAVTGLRDNGIDYTQQQGVPVFCAFLSLGGFTEEAKAFCEANAIATAEEIAFAW